MKTIFEKSQKRQKAFSLPKDEKTFQNYIPPKNLIRETSLALPEIAEIDLTRHFAGLASRNQGIDNWFYPLGSCTMKLNPRVNEEAARLEGFSRTHPWAPDCFVQGNLEMMDHLLILLNDICGMEGGTLNPHAGAQGEFVGAAMIAAYHRDCKDFQRVEMIVPDNAHGTNPATAAMLGYQIRPIATNEKGDIDIDALRKLVSDKTAGLMLTNPNTLGLFSPVILEVAKIIHEAGGLLYYDGANLNPMLNVARPGDMGFDVLHLNLHKTFSTPHGGGGPGAGPVLCKKKLIPYLPVPHVKKDGNGWKRVFHDEKSIGRIATFHGNFGIYLRAYLYIILHGNYGLRRIAENCVLNANYLKKKIGKHFKVPFERPCMHEFVVQADRYVDREVRAYDIAKRMLDYGIHAPTVYFPLIIKECFLIEPTETESKATLDRFIEIVEMIVAEIEKDPQIVKEAPHNQTVRRLDEALAARKPILNGLQHR